MKLPVSATASQRQVTRRRATWDTMSRRQRRAATKWWWSSCVRTAHNFQEQWLLINNAKGVVD